MVIVSIGLPEKGKALCEHLGVEKGEELLFVDPDNAMYDELDLNKGVQETFFNPATPLAFKDNLFRDGRIISKELGEVLRNWKIYLPPKQDQAFNQGGAFIFNGPPPTKKPAAQYPATSNQKLVYETLGTGNSPAE